MFLDDLFGEMDLEEVGCAGVGVGVREGFGVEEVENHTDCAGEVNDGGDPDVYVLEGFY